MVKSLFGILMIYVFTTNHVSAQCSANSCVSCLENNDCVSNHACRWDSSETACISLLCDMDCTACDIFECEASTADCELGEAINHICYGTTRDREPAISQTPTKIPTTEPTPRPTFPLGPLQYVQVQTPADNVYETATDTESESESDSQLQDSLNMASDSVEDIIESQEDTIDTDINTLNENPSDEGDVQYIDGKEYDENEAASADNASSKVVSFVIIAVICSVIVIGLFVGVCCFYGRKPMSDIFETRFDNDHAVLAETAETELAVMVQDTK